MLNFSFFPLIRGLFVLLVVLFSYKSSAKNTRIIFVPGLGYEKDSERSKKRPYAENISNALNTYTRFYNSTSLTLDGSHTQFGDMLHTIACSRRPAREKSIKPTTRIYEVASGIANNWLQNPLNHSQQEQFNIMGFSQGSVTTAQAVIDLFRNPSKYALNDQFKINYLLLGGSTIRKDTRLFRELVKLQQHGKIEYIIYDEAQLPGDIVTGLGGKTIIGAIINLVQYIKEIATPWGREKNIHYLAASDKNFSTTTFVIEALIEKRIY
jgi:hypothetical protein